MFVKEKNKHQHKHLTPSVRHGGEAIMIWPQDLGTFCKTSTKSCRKQLLHAIAA